MKNSYTNSKTQPVVAMPFIKNPKIVYTMDGKVFVLGGRDVEKKVVGNCY